MSDATEKIEFTYTFTDDEGFERKVTSKIAKDSVTASEVCEESLPMASPRPSSARWRQPRGY